MLIIIPQQILHLWRLLKWYQSGIHKIPILFVLYTGYFWLVIAFFLKSLAAFSLINPHTIIHAFTSGFIGVLILAMMARVSLGHTGRIIRSSKWVNASFILINLVALIRVFVPLVDPQWFQNAILWSSSFWVFAYFIFCCAHTKILLSLRADGKEG